MGSKKFGDDVCRENADAKSKDTGELKDQYPPLRMYWPGHIVAFILLGLLVVFAFVTYPSLPDPFPTHWNAAGEADSWSSKSMGNFLGFLLMGPVILFLSLLLAESIIKWQSSALFERGGAKSELHAARQWLMLKNMRRWFSWLNAWMVFAFCCLVIGSYAPPSWGIVHDFSSTKAFFPLMLALMLLPVLWMVVVTARRQAELREKYPLEDDHRMKWGIFVNDPDAPTWVDASGGSGMNYTMNLAKPWGKFWAVVLIGFPLLVLVLLFFLPFLFG